MTKFFKMGRHVKLGVDVAIISATYWFSALLYDALIPMDGVGHPWMLPMYPIFLGIFLLGYLLFRVYDQIWKFFGFKDLVMTGAASVASGVVTIIIMYFFAPGFAHFGVPIKGYSCAFFGSFAFVITAIVIVSSRVIYKELLIYNGRKKEVDSRRKRLAIVGGGSACSALLANLDTMTKVKYKPVCIFDDDPEKKGLRVDGVPIVGSTDMIPSVCPRLDVDDILLALPSANNEVINRIVDLCSKTQCNINIMPSLADMRDPDQANLHKQVRKVEVEDLLNRSPIEFDFTEIKNSFEGKVVLVTGGGGSIGSELCRQIASYGPKQLVIMDIYENTTYEIQQELLDKYGAGINLAVEIATMCDRDEVEHVFNKYKPNYVYHAAAHKHVPLMETAVAEAVKNNIFGTYNVIEAADRHGVEKFIQISTDKAVNPTNVMGATKRFCEMIVQSMKKRSNTVFAAVRFGNVLGSNGSVIPRFRKKIKEGGPLTVTHPEMTRYFMTIPEAVRLVLLAGYSATSGNVYVLDMGQPVKISELARKMIILSGYTPGVDIEIVYTGLRPGEKLYEELIIDDNRVDKTKHEKVFIEKLPEISAEEVDDAMKKLESALLDDSRYALVNCISSVVDSYTPDSRIEDDREEKTKLPGEVKKGSKPVKTA